MKKRKISDKAVDYILTRCNEDLKNLKVEEIARGIGANRSYLSRRFKIDQNISLSDFISREKIHRALFILDGDQEKPIEELSRELGYSRTDEFVTEFKSHLAVEPARYRYLRKK